MTRKVNPQNYMVLAIATTALGVGVLYWDYQKLQGTEAQIGKLRSDAKDPKQVQSDVAAADAKLADYQKRLQHLEANVSSAAYVPTLLTDLEAFGKQNGISVTGIRPVPKTDLVTDADKSKPYDDLTIQVTGRGQYSNFKSFIQGLATFPKIVAARTVSLTPTKSGGPNDNTPPHTLDITLEIKAYVFKSDNTAPASTTTAQGTTPPVGTPPAAGAAPTPGAQTPASGSGQPAVSPTTPPGKTALLQGRRHSVEG